VIEFPGMDTVVFLGGFLVGLAMFVIAITHLVSVVRGRTPFDGVLFFVGLFCGTLVAFVFGFILYHTLLVPAAANTVAAFVNKILFCYN
jgi:hypothetical protein